MNIMPMQVCALTKDTETDGRAGGLTGGRIDRYHINIMLNFMLINLISSKMHTTLENALLSNW